MRFLRQETRLIFANLRSWPNFLFEIIHFTSSCRPLSSRPHSCAVKGFRTALLGAHLRTGQAPCRARASVRACTRCCSSASSPAEGGLTCCSGVASSCTAPEGPPLTFLSLRQQSRRSRWRSRRMASTLRPLTATTPSRCGLLSRARKLLGPPPQCPAQHLGPHHTPQHRTARSMGRARGGVAARTGTAAWGRVPPTPRAPPLAAAAAV